MEGVTPRGLRSPLTVITVVKDDPTGFAQTLRSLERQSPRAFEWVVVDSSSDRSRIPDLLQSAKLKPVYMWVEPSGIYPAMNLGATSARESFLYFLNAGDTLYEADTLDKVTAALTRDNPTWAFGSVQFRNQFDEVLQEPAWEYNLELQHQFRRGRFPAHQGLFVRHDVFDQLGGFDTSYKITADYHMVIQLSLVHDPLILGFTVANFTQGGASTKSWRLAQSEFRRARKEVFPRDFRGFAEEIFHSSKAHVSHLVVNSRSRSR